MGRLLSQNTDAEDLNDMDRGNVTHLQEAISGYLTKKEGVVQAAVCAILSSGHILLEDVPGVGKTTFIKALGKMIELDVSRIQFTSDLLPADIIGVEIFNPNEHSFKFHKGPLFSNIILADEINRASPRTQSALLEAMGEGTVTVDQKSIRLPRPFIVFASQNPSNNIGTYDLPESQLDRFSARVSLGYPSCEQEIGIFELSSNDPLREVPAAILKAETLVRIQMQVEKITISADAARYVRRVVEATRTSEEIQLGISTRGGVMWLRMARANAYISGRDYVVPDDLQALADACLGHRVVVRSGQNAIGVIRDIINSTRVV